MKRIQQFPPCRRRLDIIHEANVALTSKIILIVACEYSCLSTLPLRCEVSRSGLNYVEKPLASSPFLEGTKPASRDSRLHQMAMESLFAGYDEKRLLFPRCTFGCIEGSQLVFWDPGFALFEYRDPVFSLFVAGIRNYGAEMCTGC